MEFTLTFIFGLAILAAGIILILCGIRKIKKIRRRMETLYCDNCYYRGDKKDFTPCPDCENGSKFKDYGEGQAEDMIRDWRL